MHKACQCSLFPLGDRNVQIAPSALGFFGHFESTRTHAAVLMHGVYATEGETIGIASLNAPFEANAHSSF